MPQKSLYLVNCLLITNIYTVQLPLIITTVLLRPVIPNPWYFFYHWGPSANAWKYMEGFWNGSNNLKKLKTTFELNK